MLGKAHWFKRRKYAGWGLFPATWQGWVYLLVAVSLIMVTQILPVDQSIRVMLMFILVIILIIDVMAMMMKMPMDERDRLHEALAERNALWAVIVVLAAGIGWQSYTSAIAGTPQVDPAIIAALLAGVAVKAATNIYLDKKD